MGGPRRTHPHHPFTAFHRHHQPLLIVEYVLCRLWHLSSCHHHHPQHFCAFYYGATCSCCRGNDTNPSVLVITHGVGLTPCTLLGRPQATNHGRVQSRSAPWLTPNMSIRKKIGPKQVLIPTIEPRAGHNRTKGRVRYLYLYTVRTAKTKRL